MHVLCDLGAFDCAFLLLDRFSLVHFSIRAPSSTKRECMIIIAPQFNCEDHFEGGGWALVRRVSLGSTWHPATDDLQGTSFYGSYDVATSHRTFSKPFASLITSDSTQFLFATGLRPFLRFLRISSFHFFLLISSFLSLCSGDFSKWMIATWQSINNGGAGYAGGTRLVEKSSLSQSPCLRVLLTIASTCSFNRCLTDGAPWVWSKDAAQDPYLQMYD
jgi:hypothetical protein